jgi:hypothetical protein
MIVSMVIIKIRGGGRECVKYQKEIYVFQASLKFIGKSSRLLLELDIVKWSIRVGSALFRLIKLARDKHSSLFRCDVSDEEKWLITLIFFILNNNKKICKISSYLCVFN